MSLSAAAPLIIDEKSGCNEIFHKNIEILEDTRKTLDFKSLPHSLFRTVSENIGISSSAWWVKIRVENPSDSVLERILEVDYPSFRRVTLYYYLPDGRLYEKTIGAGMPFSERPVMLHTLAFPLKLSPGKMEIVMRVENPLIKFPIKIWEKEAFYSNIHGENTFYGWVLGIILFIILFNLILFQQTSDRIHLTYSLYILICLTGFLSYLGYGFQYIWTSWPYWNSISMIFSINLVIASHILFAVDLLKLKQRSPLINKVMIIVSGIFILNSVLVFLLPPWVVFKATILLDILLLPCAVAGVWVPFREKDKAVYYYFAGCIVFTLSVSLTLFKNLGKDPIHEGINHYIGIAMVAEIILFSIAIGMRAGKKVTGQADNRKQPQPVPNILQPPPPSVSVPGLTSKENEVLRHLSAGMTYKEVAEILDVSQNTVKTHLRGIYSKMNVRNRAEAVLKFQETAKVNSLNPEKTADSDLQ